MNIGIWSDIFSELWYLICHKGIRGKHFLHVDIWVVNVVENGELFS